MIRHAVFIRFRPSVTDHEIADMFDAIGALRAQLPGIRAVDVGPNVSPEVGMDKGFSRGFIIDFDTAADRDAYLEHPDHEAVAARLVAAAVDGADGILVFDMETS